MSEPNVPPLYTLSPIEVAVNSRVDFSNFGQFYRLIEGLTDMLDYHRYSSGLLRCRLEQKFGQIII